MAYLSAQKSDTEKNRNILIIPDPDILFPFRNSFD